MSDSNATTSVPPSLTLISLHKHWLTADSLNEAMKARGIPADTGSDLQTAGEMFSRSLALFVWYGLLYVVIEGYRELRFVDQDINALLAEGTLVENLRLLRNGIFHYQKDPVPEKVMKFLQEERSAQWINQLNSAFNRFFVNELNIPAVLANLNNNIGRD